MRISLAAKRKPRVDGHEGAESRISEIERETAESAKKREQKTDCRLGRTGQTEIRARRAFERQTAVADVAGGDGIAGRFLGVKKSKISGTSHKAGESSVRFCLETDWLRRLGPVRDTCARRSAILCGTPRRPTPLSAMRDRERTGG